METKLKLRKVAELKDLLSRAQVPIAAKANKPDLIAKIISTPAALAIYDEIYGGESMEPSRVGTPRPPVASSLPAEKRAVEKQKVSLETPKESDILAPPEPFDWSAGVEPTAAVPAKPASKRTASTTTKPPSSKTATAPAAQKGTQAKASQPAADEDEETRKRRERAQRFGLPYVEKPANTPPKKVTKQTTPSSAKPATPSAAANGTGAKKATAKPTTILAEDSEKLKARALRFGLALDKANAATLATSSAGAIAGQKRSAPAVEAIDQEEAERRRKRAERFGLPSKA